MYKKDLKAIIELFLLETNHKRTVLNGIYNSITHPTFQDFINWLEE